MTKMADNGYENCYNQILHLKNFLAYYAIFHLLSESSKVI